MHKAELSSELHKCLPNCQGCLTTQKELLKTPEGSEVLQFRYGQAISTPQTPREVRACARVRNGDILPIGENSAESIIGAIAEGAFLNESTLEVAIYKVPEARDIKGVATVALERLSDKAAHIARISGENQLTLVAEIAKDNEKSVQFFRKRGYVTEDPLGFLQTGFHELSRSIDL
jgi:hypothetical protein